MEERDGLYFIRLEQILSPDELSCLVLMSHPHCRPEILETGKALAADINLWHNRLHISPKRIRAIYDLGAVEGLGIKNLPEHGPRCNCEACRIARASRKSVPKVRHYDMAADKPFHTVATDVKVVNTTSLSGFNYSMHFVDEFSRYSHIYFMRSKDKKESRRVLEEFLSDVRRLGWRVGRIRSDLGSEYVNNSTSKGKLKFESLLSEFEKYVSAKTSPSRKHQRMDRRSTELSNDFTARLVKWRMHFCIMAGCPLFFGNLHIVIRTGCTTDWFTQRWSSIPHMRLFLPNDPVLTGYARCSATCMNGKRPTRRRALTKGGS